MKVVHTLVDSSNASRRCGEGEVRAWWVSRWRQFKGFSVLGDAIVQACAISNLFEASLEVIGEVHASPGGGGLMVSRSLHVFTPAYQPLRAP